MSNPACQYGDHVGENLCIRCGKVLNMSGEEWFKRYKAELQGEVFPFAKLSDVEVRNIVEICTDVARRASRL